jgi:hypothetical protein
MKWWTNKSICLILKVTIIAKYQCQYLIDIYYSIYYVLGITLITFQILTQLILIIVLCIALQRSISILFMKKQTQRKKYFA